MKRKSLSYRLLVTVCSLANVLIAGELIMVLRQPGELTLFPLVYLLSVDIAFFILVVVLLGRKGRVLQPDFNLDQARQDRNAAALLKIGDLPLSSLVLYALLLILYIGSLVPMLKPLGVRSTQVIAFSLYIFSFGLLTCAFIYILSDRIVARTLLGSNIVRYPGEMRCTRQYRKVIIIPFFICVMSLLYALSLFLLFYEARANNAANMGRILVVFVVASCAFFASVIVLVVTWGWVTALVYRSITGQLDQLSSAEKDLGKRISVVSVDELGTISGLVNDFCEGLYVSVKSIKEAQGGLLQLGEELRQGAANAAVAVERITSGIKTVREKSRVQADSVSESSSAVEEIAKNIDSLETMIADQAASISEASASIEEMVSNISSVTNSIEMMSEQFSSLMRSADDGIAAQSDSRRKIDEISAASQTLLEANAIISSIASQTNLLAMNAAIEAAHAGEAGRGFSVVADEIRKLAKTSSVQTKKISSEIKLVQRAIEEAVAASKGSEKAFSMVSGQIDKTEAIVREVKHAMIEQKEGSTQILEALRAMNELTSQVQAGSREMSDGNNAILAEITQLKKSTDEIMQSIEKISSGSEEVDRSMKKVSEPAEKTLEHIRVVEGEVGRLRT